MAKDGDITTIRTCLERLAPARRTGPGRLRAGLGLGGLDLAGLGRRLATRPGPADRRRLDTGGRAVDRLGGDDDATATAMFTRLGVGLQQAGADPLAGHLDQAE